MMTRQVLLVERGHADAFRSIGEALAEAREGALISLAAGRYEESLVITQAVTLAAVEGGSALLHAPAGSTVVVQASGVRLAGLVVSGSDPLVPVIDVRRGQAALEGCAVSGQGWAAVLAQEEGAIAVRDCQIARLSGAGVVVTSAGANVVEGTSVEKTGSSAVAVTGAGVLTVRDCELREPGGNGIWVAGQGRAVVEGTTVRGSGLPALAVEEEGGAKVSELSVTGGSGVDAYLAGTGPVRLEGCSFAGAAQQSVLVAGGSLVLKGCVLSPAGGDGLHVTGAARVRVAGCQVVAAVAGITVDAASTVELTRVTISHTQADRLVTWGATMTAEELARLAGVTADSDSPAIIASGGAQVTVTASVLRGCGIVAGGAVVTAKDTEIADAPHDGILLLPGAALTAAGCRVHGSGRDGLDIREGAAAALTSCTINDSHRDGIRHAPGTLTGAGSCKVTGSGGLDLRDLGQDPGLGLGPDPDPDAYAQPGTAWHSGTSTDQGSKDEFDAFAGLANAADQATSDTATADEAGTAAAPPPAVGVPAGADDAFPRPNPALRLSAAALARTREGVAGTTGWVSRPRNLRIRGRRIRVTRRAGGVAAVALTCLIVALSAPLWVRHTAAGTHAPQAPRPTPTVVRPRPVASSASGREGPFGGAAAAVPGTVQAANYDAGGQGVAYNVAATHGTGGTYRRGGVDLQSCSDTGCDLGWTMAGQWFKYTVNVAAAGTYSAGFQVASPSGVTDGLHVASSSGKNLSGAVSVPDTGGSQDWATTTATVTLPAGRQTLTVYQDNGGWSVRSLTFTARARAHAGPARALASPLAASAPSLSFGSQTTATTSGVHIVTVSNRNTTAVAISRLAVSGPFSQVNTCGPSIPANGSCVISVRFKPTAARSASGSLTVASNAPGGSPLTVALSGTGAAPTNINPAIWYQVVNSNSGDCVDDTNGAVSDGTAVQQWACFTGNTNQEWQFLPTSGGYYKVVTRNDTSEAWGVSGGPGATSGGTPIQLWTYDGGTNQQWLATLQSNGSYTFTARNSGDECLDVTNHSTANGTQLQQWTCTAGDTAQTFQLTPAS
jgi:hypothetical protein